MDGLKRMRLMIAFSVKFLVAICAFICAKIGLSSQYTIGVIAGSVMCIFMLMDVVYYGIILIGSYVEKHGWAEEEYDGIDETIEDLMEDTKDFIKEKIIK